MRISGTLLTLKYKLLIEESEVDLDGNIPKSGTSKCVGDTCEGLIRSRHVDNISSTCAGICSVSKTFKRIGA